MHPPTMTEETDSLLEVLSSESGISKLEKEDYDDENSDDLVTEIDSVELNALDMAEAAAVRQSTKRSSFAQHSSPAFGGL